ncbi:MAG: rod shape-determining protein MreD [Nitrospiraceae bacterium]|nr:rod shape-determining protein MreD [Nitrospiraceae bacterium]MDA8326682.1 rod shape-determining protein MreD [Nitrospiraceae bacterium]
MKYARLFFFVLIALLADMKLSVSGFRPDLMSFLVYWFGYSHSYQGGMLFGAALGTVEDSLNMGLIGPGTLSKAVIGFLASFLSKGFFRWTPLLGFFSAMLLTIAGGLLEFASNYIFGKAPDGLFREGILLLLSQGLLNGILGIFLRPAANEP